jgi:hypothetical protein
MLSKKAALTAVALVALAAICTIVVLRERSSYNTSRMVVVAVDTAKLDALSISLADDDTVINIERVSNRWLAVTSHGKVEVRDEIVGELLAAISNVEAERLMTNSERQWSQYGVGAAGGSRVLARGNGRVLADFYCGSVDFDASTRQIWTYVRSDSETAVYKTDGYLNLAITRCVEACKRLMHN